MTKTNRELKPGVIVIWGGGSIRSLGTWAKSFKAWEYNGYSCCSCWQIEERLEWFCQLGTYIEYYYTSQLVRAL